MALRRVLPGHHLEGDSKEVIRLATALIATMSALVLALLFSSTRTSFEHNSASLSRMTADIVELDQLLEEYGPEAKSLRKTLRSEIQPMIDSIWRDDAEAHGVKPIQKPRGEVILAMLRELTPKTPAQASIQARALQVGTDLAQTHLALFAQPSDAISSTFMAVLVMWLMFIFGVFSMSSSPNPTLTIILFVCILSASAAIYLVMELGLPFGGLMQLSSDSLRNALK
ncbi:MAG: hypothetical protein JSR90_17010 [Proteobacteria bacterium]|nr:hypothetical protein [Pseudomonadota bacterium]